MTERKMKLTARTVDRLEPAASRFTIWDEDLPGFGVRVEPTGRRTFIARYRAEGGGRRAPLRQATIGAHPTLGVAEARRAARDLMAAARLGGDPLGDRRARRAEMTVAELIEAYAADGLVVSRGRRQGEPMKPLTARYTIARLRHHVVPVLGARRLSTITPGDIATLARAVRDGKTAKDEKAGPRTRIIVRGGEGAARKVVRDLSAVFGFAIDRKLVTENPVTTAKVVKVDGRRERTLTLDEVKRLGAALAEIEAEGANRKATAIARLWALTGCRRNEIAALKWSEIDWVRGLLVLADSKTGKSIRPLGAGALAVLEDVRARSIAEGERHAEEGHPGDSPYVFPAERGGGFYQGTKRIWPAAIKRAGLAGVSPHTLRHTVGGAAASSGEALLLVGAILGHANARSTAIYAHVEHDPARLAAERVTAPIAAALGVVAAVEGQTAD